MKRLLDFVLYLLGRHVRNCTTCRQAFAICDRHQAERENFNNY